MEMVALSSSELETLEPVEIKLLSRKPQTIWTIRTVEPIIQKLLQRALGPPVLPHPHNTALKAAFLFFSRFSLFFPPFYYHTSELLPHSRPARQVKMLSPGHQSWLLVLPHPQHLAAPVWTIQMEKDLIRQKNKTRKHIYNSNHRKGWQVVPSYLSCFFSCTSRTITRRG